MIGSAAALARWIETHDDIAVIVHFRPDGDAYGSALALTAAIRALGKRAFPACDDPVEPKYRFLPGWEDFATAETMPFQPKAALGADVSDRARMGKLADVFDACPEHAVIDHHDTNEGFGEVCYVDENAASTGEIALGVIEELGLVLTPAMAVSLYTAISTDSGNFSFQSTSPGTLRAAAECLEAGVDVVDCAISPMALGTSQPATEAMVATLQGTSRDTGLDMAKLSEAAAHFRGVAEKLDINPKVLKVDVNTLLYQVPGGMLSNLISQLKQAGKEDKYYDVLAEIPRVRKDFGYPPLVTPSSQIVGTQAVMNIIMGERYKTFPKESRAMLKGEYGKLPGEVNEEVRAKAGIAPEDVITCRPADLLEPELEKYKAEYKDIAKSEEDVLSLALFPQVAPKFIEKRDHPVAEAAPAATPAAPAKSADPNAVRELYVEWKG